MSQNTKNHNSKKKRKRKTDDDDGDRGKVLIPRLIVDFTVRRLRNGTFESVCLWFVNGSVVTYGFDP